MVKISKVKLYILFKTFKKHTMMSEKKPYVQTVIVSKNPRDQILITLIKLI